MMDFYFYFKALHIIGAIAWFAAMFYMPRIFVYHVEANHQDEPKRSILQEEYVRMADRLYRIIMTPAMVFTLIFGFAMIALNPAIMKTGPWLHIKLLLVFFLTAYHGFCKVILKKLAAGTNTMNSAQMRFFNEIPTLILIGIVLLAVVGRQQQLNYTYFGIVVAIIAVLLFMATQKSGKKADKKS